MWRYLPKARSRLLAIAAALMAAFYAAVAVFFALWWVATGYLHEQGIGEGEPVALTMSQSPLHLVAFLALARLGAVVVPVSPFLRPADRAETFAKYGIRVAVADRPDMVEGGAR